MASNQVKSGNVGEKKVLKKIEIEVKKGIIEKYERGVRVTDLAAEYKKSKSTISTILKQKEAIKAANVARGVTMLTKQRPQVLEEVEKLLLVWLNEKKLSGDSVSEAIICEKAKKIHSNLRQKYPSSSGESDEFKASRGWLEKFRKRSGIHSVVRNGEAARSDAAVAEAFAKDFAKFVEAEGYVPQQVFNCDETGLFWKKMPKRTYITQEEKAIPGHKPMKDRLNLLLCANASGDLKIKPLVVYQYDNPRAFKQHNVNKARLPVMWRANTKGWVTRSLFLEWLHETFAPAARKYLSDNHLPERCLLLMDNAPAHPLSLVDHMDNDYDFIKVKFLPSSTTPFLQPMDQQVISNLKKLYTKGLFTRCFNVTEETSLTLKEFWKNHFNIVHCINLIDKAWEDVTYRTLNSAWKKLWPECVSERDFEGFEPPVVEEIVSMGKSMGLEVDSDDVEELVKDHDEELTTDELVDLQNEQHKVLTEEQSSEEEDEREVIKSDVLKDVIGKWNECQNFFEKHHPDKTLTNRVLNMMNDCVISHFRKVLMRRKRQVTTDRFLVTVGPPANRIKKQETPDPEIPEDETLEDEEIAREKTLEGERPSIAEADSPSKHAKTETMNEGGEMKIYCPICNWVVISLPALEDHMKQHRRRTESVLYQCPYCPYSTDKVATLIGHQRSHADEKPYKCRVCGEVFANSKDYCSHQTTHISRARRRKSIVPPPRDFSPDKRIHAGEKPYECAMCGKRFALLKVLVQHERTHTGEKPYKCATCGKSFAQSNTLGIHKRTHMGERPYTCDVCNRSFTHLGTLLVHKKTHSGGRSLTCPTRGKAFSEAGRLRACRQARAGSSASMPPAHPPLLRRCTRGRARLHEGVTAAVEVVASLGGEGPAAAPSATPSATPSASLTSEHGETLSFETLPGVKVECDGEDPPASRPNMKRECGGIASFETLPGVKVECDGEDPPASRPNMKQECGGIASFETFPGVKVECDGEDPPASLPNMKRQHGEIASVETWPGVKVELGGEDFSAPLSIVKQEQEESPGCETRLG